MALLDIDEIAADLETSKRTVERRWRFLRSWLADEVRGQEVDIEMGLVGEGAVLNAIYTD